MRADLQSGKSNNTTEKKEGKPNKTPKTVRIYMMTNTTRIPSQVNNADLKSLAAFQTNCTKLDPAICDVKGSVNAQGVLYSHCVWPSPGLVDADERRESQDQVPAGQQDVGASCTSIRSGVGWN